MMKNINCLHFALPLLLQPAEKAHPPLPQVAGGGVSTFLLKRVFPFRVAKKVISLSLEFIRQGKQ